MVSEPHSEAIILMMRLLELATGNLPICITWQTPDGKAYAQPLPGSDVEVLRIMVDTDWNTMLRIAEENIT